MIRKRIPLFKARSGAEDIRRVTDVVKSGCNWTTGSSIAKFEAMLARYTEHDHAVVLNSGTSALHAALLAHEIGKGDEVIVPSFTFIATANAPLMVGARPVFADIERDTFGIDPGKVQELITPKTRAIIPVHVGGQACKIRELHEIAEDHCLIMVEDCAEALGAKTDRDTPVGTFGNSSIFSFCGPKVISTGEGGAIVCNSTSFADRVRLIRSHGRLEHSDYFTTFYTPEYVMLGYNWRMSNIAAALGIAQLMKIETLIKRRINRADLMTELIHRANINIVTPAPAAGNRHTYQMYMVMVPRHRRDLLMYELDRLGVTSKVYFGPVHLTKHFRKIIPNPGNLGVTEDVARMVLSLPMYPDLTNGEIHYIVNRISRFMEYG